MLLQLAILGTLEKLKPSNNKGSRCLKWWSWGAIWIGRNPNFSPTIVNYIFGMQMGITAAHFIIDADAWKLSESKQRNYMHKRYNFLFTPPPSK